MITAGELGTKSDSPLEASDCRQRLVGVFVDSLNLLQYKRAGEEVQCRSRGLTECKLQARELNGLFGCS